MQPSCRVRVNWLPGQPRGKGTRERFLVYGNNLMLTLAHKIVSGEKETEGAEGGRGASQLDNWHRARVSRLSGAAHTNSEG